MQQLLVGLDISTTTIGFSAVVIENDKIINIDYSYFKPNKKLGQIKMLIDAKNHIISMIDKSAKKYDLEPIICVEDILVFASKTTTRTLTVLSAVNRVICVAVLEKYNNLNLLPVATIRASIRKLALEKERIPKEDIPAAIEKIMQKHIKNWKFDWELNKNGKIKPENMDKSDGIAVAFAVAYKKKLIVEGK